MTRIGVMGSGTVGEVLANGFLKHGFEVMRGSRDPQKLVDWKAKAGPQASIGNFAETAKFGEIVVCAVKGSEAHNALSLANPDNLKGKTVIDVTNPIANIPPQDGLVRYTTDHNSSLMESLQAAFPDAQFVKAFNSVGNKVMVDPDFAGTKPTMFICGNESKAKAQASRIIEAFGWEVQT